MIELKPTEEAFWKAVFLTYLHRGDRDGRAALEADDAVWMLRSRQAQPKETK